MHVKANLVVLMMCGVLNQSAVAALPAAANNPAAAFGVMAGDVTPYSAVLWSRGDRESFMHVQILGPINGLLRTQAARVTAEHDFTGKIQVSGLRPATEYRYRVWFSNDEFGNRGINEALEGRFRTPPAPDAVAPVSFTWGGDVAGQNTCRDAQEGFPIFKAISATPQDFFVGLGDMIYADGTCGAVGRYGNAQVPGVFLPAADMANYWAHWKYNRADAGLRELMAKLPYYAIWDDHEVANDFGPLHDTRTTAPYTPGDHLLPKGLAAFLDYNAVAEHPATPKRLYRSVRWGKHLELFILDTRQYRDGNFAADSETQPKTMLGREQLTWLKDSLKKSDATWKVIASSVPMAIPTGSAGAAGRDGWANYQENTGFENELLDILRFMQQNAMRNVAFVTTDVHFGEVFRYTPFSDDPLFQVYEFVTGPLNAGVFPNQAYDTTLNPERLFFFGADSADAVTTWPQAKSWFNYGAMRVDADGRMSASLRNVDGASVYEVTVEPR